MADIKSILNDIYALDPSLKKQEKELKEIISKLIEVKPDIELDENFVQTLRRELQVRAEDLTETKSNKSLNIFTMLQKFAYAFGSVAFTLTVVIGIYIYSQRQVSLQGEPMFTSTIQETGDNAFGNAAEFMANQPTNPLSSTLSSRGVGGGGMATEEAKIAASDAVMGAPGVSPGSPGMPYIYEPTVYRYVYKGDPLELKDDKLNVLKRDKKTIEGASVMNMISKLNLDLIGLDGFKDTKMQMITFMEDREFGYGVSINFQEGMIEIFENWYKWPQSGAVFAKCAGDERCVENLNLKPSDLPSDESMIAMADDFLKEHNVNMSNYGKPEINKYWEQALAVDPNATMYIPESVAVIYPLVIDGKPVVEMGGQKAGVSVNINIRHNKVSSVYGLRAENYLSSSYDAETDSAKILASAEKGGWNQMFYTDVTAKTVDVSLGTPTIAYMKIFHYVSDQTDSEEILAPVYVFPITEKPDQYFYQDYVIVPLVKGLEDLNAPYPVPMMEKGTASSDSVTSSSK
jgi:hypothetical protein